MRRDILQAATLAALAGLRPPDKQKVRVVDNPQFTKNLFGPIEEIAGKELELMERNRWGDCMCIFRGKLGVNLVDVDHRDIKP